MQGTDDHRDSGSRGSRTLKDTAVGYFERGWKPIPVPFKKKSPVLKAWQNLEIDRDFIESHFADKEQNLGVLLGEKSGSLVDIDLDAIEAVAIADRFLPATNAIFGREGKTRSHWLYVARDLRTERFQDPRMTVSDNETHRRRATLVEIRYSGGQTVFPPSVHTSGEPIEWDSDGDCLEVDPNLLRTSVRKLASASLLARYWKSGIRQDAAMALSGMLLRSGWNIRDAEHFIESVAIGANDDESDSRTSVVERTSESLKNGKEVTGIPKLKQLIPTEVVERVCDWLDLGTEKPEKSTQSEKLLGYTDGIDLFSFNGEAYATVSVKGHDETMKVESKSFKKWLQYQFFKNEGKTPTNQILQDTMGVLSGKAFFEGEEREVFLRLAQDNGRIYLDLCNVQWQIVEVSKSGWNVIEAKDSPVRFRRTKSMLPLPYPESGRDLSDLRVFVNVTDRDFVLLQAWLVAALRPDFPFTVLILSGTQGSAKSTTTSVLQDLVDPNVGSRRTTPTDERNLAITAANSWVLTLDNLSFCKPWLSDALCRLATGGSLASRTLYENDEETLFTAKRPMILNSIEDIATRPDLLERALLLQLPKIDKNRRIDEEEFQDTFKQVRPYLLGSLLDAVVEALSNLDQVRLDEKPRMADFAKWSVAAEGKLSFPESIAMKDRSFLKLYLENLESGHAIAIESSPLVKLVESLLDQSNGIFRGTATELHGKLSLLPNANGLPKNGRTLSGALRRLSDPLMSVGILLRDERDSNRNRTRLITLQRIDTGEGD